MLRIILNLPYSTTLNLLTTLIIRCQMEPATDTPKIKQLEHNSNNSRINKNKDNKDEVSKQNENNQQQNNEQKEDQQTTR